MADCFRCVGKSFTRILACCLCDLLCCECNCVIFPAPHPSYERGVVCLNEDSVKTVILNFLISGKQIPYVEVSTEKSRQSKKCFIYFHGNAQDIGLVGLFLQPLVLYLNITFYAIQYPTYSYYQTCWAALISNRIKEDALNFYDFLLNNNRSTEDIYVMGRSIGSGGASYLAGNRKIPILILMSPFDSIKKVSSSIVGCMGYVVKQHFNNEQEIVKHNGQLLVIHGEADEVIGIKHGKNLVATFEYNNTYKKVAKTNYPKRMTHNNFNIEKDIIQPIKSFLEM